MSDLSSLTKPLEQQLQAARAQLESAQDSVKSKEKEFRQATPLISAFICN